MVCSVACLFLGAFALLAGASADDCIYSLEIMQLQDASDSFKDDLTNMQAVAPDLFSQLSTIYPGMKFGLASFVDKPIPERGYGPYGGYQDAGIVYDYCYKSVIPMTQDSDTYQKAISDLTVGSGFDFPENQLEGMLRCALDQAGTGYSAPEVTHDASGRPIVRVMIMITDAIPHAVGDAAGATTSFWDFRRTEKSDGTTTGGFGADDFATAYDCIIDIDSYNEILPYFHKIDNGETLQGDDLTQYNALLTKVGPYPFPGVVPHPGDDSLPCEAVEYPTAAQFGNALAARNIFPVILLATVDPGDTTVLKNCPYQEKQQCLEWNYQELMTQAGVPSYIQSLTAGSADIVSAITYAVGNITQDVCIGSTLPPATMPTTSTGNPGGGSTTTTSTTTPHTAAAGGGGIPIGPIAGAAAGGVAAIAAGIFAYKKWGAGLLGKKTDDEIAAPQVDVPEAPVEREALEEVTMEMFQ